MAFRRMTRMISFRVSEDEFERLRAKSQAEGARSVSDYARIALAREAKEGREGAETSAWLDHLQRLSSDVHRLTELLDHPQSSFEGHPDLTVVSKKAWRDS